MQLKDLHLDLLESHASLKRRHESLSEEQVQHVPLLCQTVSLRAQQITSQCYSSACLHFPQQLMAASKIVMTILQPSAQSIRHATGVSCLMQHECHTDWQTLAGASMYCICMDCVQTASNRSLLRDATQMPHGLASIVRFLHVGFYIACIWTASFCKGPQNHALRAEDIIGKAPACCPHSAHSAP